jgi:hypothetical protein
VPGEPALSLPILAAMIARRYNAANIEQLLAGFDRNAMLRVE